jgi:hypothetical protein
MGDVAGSATGADLAAQVNRFGPSAPSGYQFVTEPIPAPLTALGVTLLPISVGLATIALTIYQRRATDSYNQFHDTGSSQAIAAANAGFADPVGFVTSNLNTVTQTLQAFADSLGIPAAAAATSPADDSSGTLLLVAGAALVAWLLLGGGK